MTHRTNSADRWRPVVTFVVLAYALAWLVALPLWIDPRHLAAPYAAAILVAMMGTPLVAALAAGRLAGRRGRAVLTDLALGPGTAGRRPGRFLAVLGAVAGLVYLVVLGGLATSALLGTFVPDLRGFSGLREALAGSPGAGGVGPGMPLGLLAALMIAGALVNGLVNAVPAMGEEAGWRGFLFPRLRELVGTGPALVGTGVVWGCWHAPVVLLGYNYPTGPRWLALGAMSVMCTLLGTVLAWGRTRAGTTWVAAYGHGLFNALAGSSMVALGSAGHPVDPLHGSILGWAGWPVAAAVAVVLAARLCRPTGRS